MLGYNLITPTGAKVGLPWLVMYMIQGKAFFVLCVIDYIANISQASKCFCLML